MEGQVEGEVAQGIGYAPSEEMKFDDKGRMKNPSFKTYKLPTSLDVPEMETELVRSYEPTGPYRVKSVGEIEIVPPAPAIANAIYGAVGGRIRDLPITSPKIIEKLGK